MNERFSMKEFTPLTFLEKKQKIVDEIELLEIERQPIAAKKKEIDEKLGEYNALLKSEFFPDLEYKRIYKQKSILIKEKQELEQSLMKINNQLKLKHRESDRAHLQSKSIPNDKLKTVLTELRDKYLSFSADTTRVASMRSMSSRFVEEIQLCLKYVD